MLYIIIIACKKLQGAAAAQYNYKILEQSENGYSQMMLTTQRSRGTAQIIKQKDRKYATTQEPVSWLLPLVKREERSGS